MTSRLLPVLVVSINLTLPLATMITVVDARTWVVSHEGGDTDSLSAAYRMCASNDTILIHPGRYVVDYSGSFGIVDGKAITIVGSSGVPADVAITSEATYFLNCGDLVFRGVMFEGGVAPLNVAYTNLTVSACIFRDVSASAVSVSGGQRCTVSSCVFVGNGAPHAGVSDGAIWCHGQALHVSDCLFDGNVADDAGGAIWSGNETTIARSMFVDNSAPSGAAVVVLAHGSTITECTFYANRGATAVDVEGNDQTVVFDRVIVAKTIGGSGVYCDGPMWLTCSDFWQNDGYAGIECFPAESTILLDPMFCDPENGDFRLKAESPCLPGNHPSGADCGTIGAFGPCGVNPTHRITWGGIKARYGGAARGR